MANYRKQQGVTTVEMAIVSAVFFTVLIAVIEMGRLSYTLNVLDEVTRRGARLASVCPVTQIPAIQNRAVSFANNLGGLTPNNLEITYWDDAGNPLDPVADFTDISYVRARIINFSYQLLIPFFFRNLDLLPQFSTTSVAESLGIVPAPPAGEAGYGTPTC